MQQEENNHIKNLDHHFSLSARKLIFLSIILIVTLSLNSLRKIPEKKELVYGPDSYHEISRGNTEKRQVIFTFDGGSGNSSTEDILKALEKHHIKGTFFLTGKFVEKNPELVKKIKEGGHEIFSHTYDHPHLTEISDANIIKEFEDMDKVLFETVGIHSKPYFRPPYGDRDERVLRVAAQQGYRSVFWTIDARDWMEEDGESDFSVADRIMLNLKPGTIYLMHLGDSITGKILDKVFSEIEKLNYRIVSLTEGIQN